MATLDLEFVRSQFPAFDEPSLQEQAFFDNAGGAYACLPVIVHLNRYYHQNKLQPYHLHPVSQDAGKQMDASYDRLAGYLNVLPEEVHLGPSTSQNTYVLAQAFAKVLQAGDEIIVTNQDHEANIGVWRRLVEQGIEIKEWRVDPITAELDPKQLESLIGPRTKLLAFNHCSNVVAHINPVKAICEQARQAGVWTVVDGVAMAGHGFADVRALGADIYLFSLYKAFGPHLGAMVIRQAMAEVLGNQGHYFNQAYRHKWFVPAGPDHAQVAAAQGVVDYFDRLHDHHFEPSKDISQRAERVRKLLHDAEAALLPQLLDYVSQHPKLTLVGPADYQRRSATVSLLATEFSPQELAAKLVKQGIICAAGHFYAVRLLEALGVDPESGVLRFSLAHYTSQADLDQLLDALDRVL
ncbi:aminotransferase class V-fold PLP-dependent enzyme [Marinomonas ostreistagni]|uniref:aminotransferase class V-fold PLP-dependent enzyme n=1 Tax=Marinomonas ostreistagni TaxID=359209 RepID=UPI0019523D14|nr:aminotransferase class V-fold PLP-dependent enzyme [Marinomonas ostreistagni]MBM6550627.1 aminotransferase class V-fold PLP-dependent enzyme [Marinomonas ostreistagni]